MSLSNSILAYEDCFKFFDMALEAKKGIRITYGEERIATYQTSRFNKARILDRERNTKIHAEGTPLYGHSTYDGISIRKREDKEGVWYVVLVKLSGIAEDLVVHELPDDYDEWEAPRLPPPRVQLELLPAPTEDGQPQVYGTNVRRI